MFRCCIICFGDDAVKRFVRRAVKRRLMKLGVKEMPICTYDNPATMSRECWQDGELLCHYQSALFFIGVPIPASHFFFGANIGEWKAGQLRGDKNAMIKANEDNKKQATTV